jgi:hypothetical protein
MGKGVGKLLEMLLCTLGTVGDALMYSINIFAWHNPASTFRDLARVLVFSLIYSMINGTILSVVGDVPVDSEVPMVTS